MSLKLCASNLGWQKTDDERVYALLQSLGYTGLEMAPTRIFPQSPYDALSGAALFGGYLYKKYGLTVPSLQSIWYGKNESIFDPGAADRLADYTADACEFARALRCPNLVFGCPRQRNIPDGHTAAEADDFLARLGMLAGQRGVYLALEANPPIYNTNYLNTTREALALVRRLQLPGLTVNLDVGTMVANGENVAEFAGGMQYVSHVHISEPGLVPIQKRALHRELAGLLHATGYQGFVSVEMKAADFETVEQSLAYVAEVFA